MKKLICGLLSALFILTLTLGASAKTVITVSGTGETAVPADTAVVMLGMSMRDREVTVAQQKVNEKIAAIREALTAIGIPEENVNTNYLNIYAVYDYERDNAEIKGYEAASSLSIKVTDIETVGRVIDAAFAAGANTLDGISFSAGDTAAAQAASLEKAVADAKAKAETLAAANGLSLTGVTAVNEGGTWSYDNSMGNFSAKEEAAADEASGSTVVRAAKIIVSATVNVTYEAE